MYQRNFFAHLDENTGLFCGLCFFGVGPSFEFTGFGLVWGQGLKGCLAPPSFLGLQAQQPSGPLKPWTPPSREQFKALEEKAMEWRALQLIC